MESVPFRKPGASHAVEQTSPLAVLSRVVATARNGALPSAFCAGCPAARESAAFRKPGAPHAFVPKVGIAKPDNWEIAFIAITPRNLKEDTHRVSDEVRALYKQVVGQDAPLGV